MNWNELTARSRRTDRLIVCKHCGRKAIYKNWAWDLPLLCKHCGEQFTLSAPEPFRSKLMGLGYRAIAASVPLVLIAGAIFWLLVLFPDASTAGPERVIVVPGSDRYHTEDCEHLDTAKRGAVSLETALQMKYRPAPCCHEGEHVPPPKQFTTEPPAFFDPSQHLLGP